MPVMAEFTWPDGKTLALSIVVNVEEGAEMSVAEGDKRPEPVDELGVAVSVPIRNYVNESNYRYGLNAGGPRIFRLLREHDMRATVTAAAVSLERAPDLTRTIVDAGHELASHGQSHVRVHQQSPSEFRDDVSGPTVFAVVSAVHSQIEDNEVWCDLRVGKQRIRDCRLGPADNDEQRPVRRRFFCFPGTSH